MANILKKIYDNDRRELKKFEKLATKVESLGDEYEKLSDEQLQAKTPEFRKRLENGETLDDILPEAFATAREGAKEFQDYILSVFKLLVVLHSITVILPK